MNIVIEKNFICQYCSKKLSTKQRLLYHMSSKSCTNEPATKKQKRDEPHLENRPKLEMVLQVLNVCKLQNFDAEKTKYELIFTFSYCPLIIYTGKNL